MSIRFLMFSLSLLVLLAIPLHAVDAMQAEAGAAAADLQSAAEEHSVELQAALEAASTEGSVDDAQMAQLQQLSDDFNTEAGLLSDTTDAAAVRAMRERLHTDSEAFRQALNATRAEFKERIKARISERKAKLNQTLELRKEKMWNRTATGLLRAFDVRLRDMGRAIERVNASSDLTASLESIRAMRASLETALNDHDKNATREQWKAINEEFKALQDAIRSTHKKNVDNRLGKARERCLTMPNATRCLERVERLQGQFENRTAELRAKQKERQGARLQVEELRQKAHERLEGLKARMNATREDLKGRRANLTQRIREDSKSDDDSNGEDDLQSGDGSNGDAGSQTDGAQTGGDNESSDSGSNGAGRGKR